MNTDIDERRFSAVTQMRLPLESLSGAGLLAAKMPGETEIKPPHSNAVRESITTDGDLETFCYSVAHDLRSPIRQVVGLSKIVSEEYASQLPIEVGRILEKIANSAQRAGALIDDLLNFAQVSRRVLSLQTTPLNSIVTDAIESLKPCFAGRNIRWRIGALSHVLCDHDLMSVVLVNLLSNALKFSAARNPAVIEVGQFKMGDEQVVFVRDNGIGFDMQYASKLFGIFQRLHSGNEFSGTGMGLAVVDRIMRMHGNKVWAHAELDAGASFYFTVHTHA